MGLSQAAFDRILRKAGAERVSDDASRALREIMEDIANDLAVQAVRVAGHAGRKTIRASDIDLITKKG